MANLGKVLEQELSKIVSRAIKEGIRDLQQENRELRKAIARLEKKAGVSAAERLSSTPGVSLKDIPDVKITGRGLKMLRNKLGLSANDFANLVGVSLPSVYKWEATSGALPLRSKARIGLAEAKNMTQEEAIAKLESMGYRLGRKARSVKLTPPPEERKRMNKEKRRGRPRK